MPRKKKTKLKTAFDVASHRLFDSGGNYLPIKPQASTMYDGSYPWNGSRPRTIFISDFYNRDFSENVNIADWNILLSRARELYANVGSVRSAIAEITDLAVGDGWYAKYYGEDTVWGATAEEWISSWMSISDIRGQPWDFHRGLKLACISVLRDGDCLAILSSDASGNYPRVQWIPAHRIGSWGNGELKSGPFIGYNVDNGIITNGNGNIVGFNILGNKRDGSDDKQVSVVDSQLVFDPEYIEQSRGITALASGVADWLEYKTIKGFELQGIKHAANFAVQMYIPEEERADVAGEYADSPYATQSAISGSNRNLTVETLQGGEVNVWRPDSGARLEVLQSNRPGPNTAQFLLDHCLRNSFLSLRWPVELSFDLNSRGATTKLVVAKAQRRIEDIQMHVIYPVWKRLITYAVAKAIKAGYLPKNKHWWKFEPTFPRQFVLDNFKDLKSDVEMYNKGWTTSTQVAAAYGWDWRKNIEEKARELAYADEIATKYNLNRGDLVVLTQQGNTPEAPLKPNETEEENNTGGDSPDNEK